MHSQSYDEKIVNDKTMMKFDDKDKPGLKIKLLTTSGLRNKGKTNMPYHGRLSPEVNAAIVSLSPGFELRGHLAGFRAESGMTWLNRIKSEDSPVTCSAALSPGGSGQAGTRPYVPEDLKSLQRTK